MSLMNDPTYHDDSSFDLPESQPEFSWGETNYLCTIEQVFTVLKVL